MSLPTHSANELIARCSESVADELCCKNINEIRSSLPIRVHKVIEEELIHSLIDAKAPSMTQEAEKRLRYDLSLELKDNTGAFAKIYLPEPKIEFRRIERLCIPALVGAILFGLIFFYTLGGFFKQELYSALIGMPLGACFFVWLFSKAIRHPKITKVIKWAAIAGLGVITVGAVFSGLRKNIFVKSKINFFQWLWLALLTLMSFWLLHIFKPVKAKNSEEIRLAIKTQLEGLLNELYETLMCQIDHHIHNGLSAQTGERENILKVYSALESDELISSSLHQMKFASKKADEKAAMISVRSFLNTLDSLGVHELERREEFEFLEKDSAYFDKYGIIQEGDKVSQLYRAWVDKSGACVFKGKVKKVRR